VLGVLAGLSKRHELAKAAHLLAHLDLLRLGAAMAFELASMMAFARLQRWLLRAGGVPLALWPMVEITFAGNALGTSLPGGAAWSATWAYGQLRRRGADRVLAAWVLLVAGALSSFALFLVIVAGAFVAGAHGPLASLRVEAAALAAIPVVAGLGALAVARLPLARTAAEAVGRALRARRHGGRALADGLARFVRRLRTVQPSALGWAEALGLALANWLFDAACLVASIWALRAAVPWHGILAAYGLTQIAASLPITPGGLGVVEASLTALLVAYGMPTADAVATTLLYRAVSFWALQPIGWAGWVALELAGRGGLRRRAHPWAVHRHAGSTAARKGPFQPTPCEGCDDTERPLAPPGDRAPVGRR
jgi:uncharacterized protein (TIRG00374 family)